MPTNKDAREAAKQKRSKANRAQREALAARTEAAKRPSREAPAASGKRPRKGTPVSTRVTEPKGGSGSGSSKERPVRERPLRPGDVPVDIDELEGSFVRKVVQVPGGRHVLTGSLLALIAVVMTVWSAFNVKTLPREGLEGEAAEKAPKIATFVERYGAAQVLIPSGVILLAAIAAVVFALRPHRRRVWLGATILMVLLTLQGNFLFLFSAGMMGFGCWKAFKVEGPQEPLFRRRRAADQAEDDDEVIETTGSEDDDDPSNG